MNNHKKILLALFPYWEILIPPMGISCLKSDLQQEGYEVKTVDANVEKQFKTIHDDYFRHFSTFVPAEKQGNFYNLGKDVLRNHLMAHLHRHRTSEHNYLELIKMIIYKTFYCEANSRQVRRLDQSAAEFFRCLEAYILELLEAEKPSVLGISIFRGTIPASIFAAKIAKKKYPHLLTVGGGGSFADQLALGSSNLDFFLQETRDYIDKIIIGEGELLFRRLLRGELPESQQVYTLRDIKGLTLDISNAPAPDFSDFEIKNYPNLGVYASRSCPFQCSFCSETLQWGNFRKKRMSRVVDEMVELSSTYQRQLFLMCDSLLNPVIDELSEELVRRDVSLYWDGYFRVDRETGKLEKTQLWRRAGFYRARLGVESGSQKILDLMDKRITVDQIRTAVSSLAHTGIKTTTYWLIGYPGETDRDFQDTLDLISELKDDIYEAWANVFWYYSYGQIQSDELREKSRLLYPEWARDLLILETRIIRDIPSREEMQERMFRFLSHCREIEVPNLYTLRDFNAADERWKKLHKNATPQLVALMDRRAVIDEHKRVIPLNFAQNTLSDSADIDFSFQ